MLQKNDIFVINPGYFMKNDFNKVILGAKDNVDNVNEAFQGFFSYIHPLNAQLFSFFNGKDTIEAILEKASKYFLLPKDELSRIIAKFIENREEIIIDNGRLSTIFPRNILVNVENVNSYDIYDPAKFQKYGEIDFSSTRLSSPITILLLLTMKCYTNCIYCYANRKLGNKSMTLELYKSIIHQAKEIGVINIDINGGEVLLHPECIDILSELINEGYHPFISTKLPLEKNMITKLKRINVKSIQLSLDSANIGTLQTLLNVDHTYLSKIDFMIRALGREGIDLNIHSILCAHNSSVGEVSKLISYLLQFPHVKSIKFSPAGFSLYRRNNSKFLPRLSELEDIQELIEQYNGTLSDADIKISITPISTADEFQNATSFSNRSFCTGNTRGFVVLPDGRVTICEELYEHPEFIIGDLTKQTISEVWNSPEACNLYNLQQKMLKKESACHSCTDYEKCRRGKGVCWKEILMAYGEENWDYPDPRCPHAPMFKRNIYIR